MAYFDILIQHDPLHDRRTCTLILRMYQTWYFILKVKEESLTCFYSGVICIYIYTWYRLYCTVIVPIHWYRSLLYPIHPNTCSSKTDGTVVGTSSVGPCHHSLVTVPDLWHSTNPTIGKIDSSILSISSHVIISCMFLIVFVKQTFPNSCRDFYRASMSRTLFF